MTTSHHQSEEAFEDEEGGYAEKDEEMYDEDMYEEETLPGVSCDSSCDPLEMEQTSDGYRLVIDVPAKFYGFIIGQKGETKKKIEQETKTQLHIPRTHSRIEEITITGRSRQGISSAKTRLDVLVATMRQKTPFTHFVALALNTKDVISKFHEFKEKVLTKCSNCQGIDERIFQDPLKLHVTIATLVLMNEHEVKTAQLLLQDCLENIVIPRILDRPMMVHVAGLEYMNDDPRKVDVLYGKITMRDGDERLQEIADMIQERFANSELCQDRHSDLGVKLHATLMNSIFRPSEVKCQRSEGRGRGQQQRHREAFDASEVLELFGDFFFGEVHIDSIHIAERGRYGEDGFYFPAGRVWLP